MIQAQEKGRRLHITVGDGDGAEAFVIDPVDVAGSGALLSYFLTLVATDLGDTPEKMEAIAAEAGQTATDMAKLAVGEANYRKVQTLRQAEAKDVIYAALFWQVQGGGLEVATTYMADGLPKAQSAVFAAAGLLPTQRSAT